MRTALIFLTFSLLALAPPQAEAQGGGGAILLSKTLITVEAHQRTATVSLANRTAKPQRYRISVIDLVMGPDGQLSAPGEEGAGSEHSASSWVVVTPRSLHLDPGRSQVIRLLFRRPPDLGDGEYRAHLKVAQEPPADSAGGLSDGEWAGGLHVNLVTVYSTSIPIVLRQGKLDVSVAVSDARRVEPDRLALTVEREGNASFRGFAHLAAGDSASINLPITVYRECDRVTLTAALGELASAPGPLTLTLHEGVVPRPGEPLPAKVLGPLTVRR